jgi:DDE family transposase
MGKLQTENTIITNEGVTHHFNLNKKMNDTLMKLGLKTGMVIPDGDNTLDYDNVIFENEKYDAAPTYKMTTGYQPGVAAIGKHVVFIEGRGGNTPASYKMDETLQSCFELLKENNIRITRFRSDSAAYQQSVIDTVKKHSTYFYIRADDSASLRDAAADIPRHEWQTVSIGYRKVEIADTPFFPFDGKTAYRVVVQRKKRKNCQGDLFTRDAYDYYGIITNNEQEDNLSAINFYNDRGASEKNFDALNNDFNCNHLPFSFMNTNTVYMCIAAMSSILFEWIKQQFYKRGAIADTSMRVKRFLFSFMLLPCKWIKTGRQWVLKIFTTRAQYKPLFE